MIKVQCYCGETYKADEKQVGYKIKCNKCGVILDIIGNTKSNLDNTKYDSTPYKKTVFDNKSNINNANKFKSRFVFAGIIFGLVVGSISVYSYYGSRKDNNLLNHLPPSFPSTALKPIPFIEPMKPITIKYIKPIKMIERQDYPLLELEPKKPREIKPIPVVKYVPDDYVPPENGFNIEKPIGVNGMGSLKVINGKNDDAAIKLAFVNNKRMISRFVFVKKKSTAILTGIEPGEYSVRFSLGDYWDNVNMNWVNPVCYEFEDNFNYYENETNDGIRYRSYDISLHPVVTGKAHTKRISKDDF